MTPDDHTHSGPPDATRGESDAALDAGLAAAFGGDTTRDARPLGAAGEVIGGRYHLIDEVGSGGMGSVWRAEQKTPVKRYVAVKLVKAGMDSKAVLARFDAERQALAVMDHPNIAKVLDGGVTADGRPYFVMELVKGTPITTFADARKLTPKQRLELFVPVCSAIQHAHMKGVIHRDIKPSNVLVALYDDKAVPKVIDFGVAKATGVALTDHTLHTGLGAVVGTPEYMSPEQASLNNLDIDTRSDVYALGVLLYELLTGSPPFARKDLEVKGLMEMLRVVREDEPLRPSAKLSTAAAKPSIAANRGTEPNVLAKLLRSELDWLVMKALEKDRNRRYESANGFAADVQRYLAGEAVQAVPPSLGYRVRKWVRKNRGLVTTSGLVAASLLAGTGVATWQAIRAEQEAERVRQEQAKTKDALGQSEKNREQAEVNLVHSYLRPIGFNTSGLDQAELIALDELARQDDDRIKLLFLREALADGERALRVARRAERVAQAAVGTSLKRREQALKLTSEKQRDLTADPRVRLAACWLAIELNSDDLPALSEGFDILLARKVTNDDLPALSVGFDILPRREVTDWNNFVDRLPTRIHPTKEILLADALAGVLGKTTDRNALWAAGEGLAALAPRLDPAVAPLKLTAAADALAGVFGKSTDGGALRAAGEGLAALAPWLDPPAASKGFDALAGVLGKTTDINALLAAGKGLVALAPRLDPPAASRGFDALVAVLGKSTNWNALRAAGEGLAVLAPRLDPAVAPLKLTAAADALAGVFGKSTDRYTLRAAGEGLAALAPRLDPAVAPLKLTAAADTLAGVFGKSTDGGDLWDAGEGLAALAPWLDPPAASKGSDALVAVLGKSTPVYVLWDAGKWLAALAPRLDPPAAARLFDALVAVLGKSTDGERLRAAGEGLAALAPRLDPPAASRGFDALAGVFGKSTDGDALRAAGYGLAALAPRLDPPAAARLFDALVAVLGKSTDGNALRAAGYGLAALAPRLDPPAASKGFDALAGVFGKTTDGNALRTAGYGLAALAPRLDPSVAPLKLTTAADTLVGVLGKTTNNVELLWGARTAIEALGRQFDSLAADRLFDTLTLILVKTSDAKVLVQIGSGMIALAPRLDPKVRLGRCSEALRLITEAIRTTQFDDVWSFAPLLAHLDSVPHVARLLRDPGCVGDLQVAVLARLEQLAYPEPAQGAVFAGWAADPLRWLTLPALQIADDDHRQQNRRFRTVSDAAKWLAEHHPDIDLDRPYHKTAPAK